MSAFYNLMTLERLPELMEPSEVREMFALIMCTMVRSKEFQELKGLQRQLMIEFCLSVQNILLGAYSESD